MTVRILRLLEYVYPDHETAEKDMGRWQLAANGRKVHGTHCIITSATMPPRTLNDDESSDATDLGGPSSVQKSCNDAVYRKTHGEHPWTVHEGPRGDVMYYCPGYLRLEDM